MISELIERINSETINNEAVQSVEEKYKCQIPEEIKHIVSLNDEDRFADDARVLSLNEILDADEILGVNFSEQGIIPVIDTFDNDFIGYNLNDSAWVKINIADEIVFDKSDDLEDLFL